MRERQRLGPIQLRASDFALAVRSPSGSRMARAFSSPMVHAGTIVLLAVVFASGMLVSKLQGPPSRPEMNVPILDLFPVGSAVRGASEADFPIRLSSKPRFILLLHADLEIKYPSYEIDLRDAAGNEVWHGKISHLDTPNGITLEIPRNFLEPGAYHLYLMAPTADRFRFVASYELEIGA